MLTLGKDTVLEGIRNFFRLKKDMVLEGIKNIFGQGKDKALKGKDIKDEEIESEKNCYKPIRISNDFSTNYIEYKSKGNKDKILFIDDYLDEIKPFLNDFIDNQNSQDEWKI